MLELLQRFEVNELCYECQIIALPRSYHCNVCRQCVQRYDHHCPWLNSCIGTRNHRPFIIFVTCQFTYLISVLAQIIGFFVTYSRSTSNLDFYDINGQLLNTCQDSLQKHFADWCTASMQPGPNDEGFFGGSIHPSSNALVLFVMVTLVIVACVFTSGLLILLITQLQNFCAGRTSMERLTGAGQRVRKFNFIEQMSLEEERYNARQLKVHQSGITIGQLDLHGAGNDGRTGGVQSSEGGGDDSDGNFMRFDEEKT